jgi:hypothetical protein
VSPKLVALALDRRDWTGAEVLGREALSLSEKVGRLELIANDHYHLAMALVRQQKKNDALSHAQRALGIYRKLGLPTLAAEQILAECED